MLQSSNGSMSIISLIGAVPTHSSKTLLATVRSRGNHASHTHISLRLIFRESGYWSLPQIPITPPRTFYFAIYIYILRNKILFGASLFRNDSHTKHHISKTVSRQGGVWRETVFEKAYSLRIIIRRKQARLLSNNSQTFTALQVHSREAYARRNLTLLDRQFKAPSVPETAIVEKVLQPNTKSLADHYRLRTNHSWEAIEKQWVCHERSPQSRKAIPELLSEQLSLSSTAAHQFKLLFDLTRWSSSSCTYILPPKHSIADTITSHLYTSASMHIASHTPTVWLHEAKMSRSVCNWSTTTVNTATITSANRQIHT